ncbi:cell wall hydrolase [Lachnospiraceae bacterium WCA-693-APC-MOT-I]|uniref:Cell wall hydrolase n=2 Tax=Velocimicrobium porci TaxID=2606634 RepID=A0A6L5Y0L8_9FIRM|nr:cell wall hydrolase [Velocimicrobium porci]
MQWKLKTDFEQRSGKEEVYMQNVHWFLPEVKIQIARGIASGMIVILSIMGIDEIQSRNQQHIVYAKTTESADVEKKQDSVTARNENEQEVTQAQVAQIQLDETVEAGLNESVEAMQTDLAREIAKEERKAKLAKEKLRLERERQKNRIQLSNTDKNVLLRIVEAEATGEDIKGKMLVANVILNRVKDDEFPDSVEKVVFQKESGVYQFSPIKDGRYYKVSISKSTRTAIERVLNGEDESKGALYFMSRRQAARHNVRWFDSSLTWLLEHGTHEFFK